MDKTGAETPGDSGELEGERTRREDEQLLRGKKKEERGKEGKRKESSLVSFPRVTCRADQCQIGSLLCTVWRQRSLGCYCLEYIHRKIYCYYAVTQL